MILGVGTDLVDIARIRDTLSHHGDRFITRCFAPSEQIYTADAPQAAAHYAKRFAAKEAAAKALGIGISGGVYLRDIIVQKAENGAPSLVLQDGAAAQLAKIGHGYSPRLHVSLSDERGHALAFVVIEGLPHTGI